MTITYAPTLVSFTPASSGAPALAEICGIVPTSLTWRQELNGPGLVTVSTRVGSLDPVGKARLRDLVATPCELWLTRTDSTTGTTTRVHAGPVTGYRINGQEITITAPGLLAHLDYARQLTDASFTATDQTLIAETLIDAWQAQTYGHRGLITDGLAATGIARTIAYAGVEAKSLLTIVTELGRRSDGFDLTVDPVTRWITSWYPSKGSNLTNSVVIDRRSIGTPDVTVSVAPGLIASELLVIAASGTGTATSTATNTTTRASFGRAATSRQFDGLTDTTALASAATAVLADLGTQLVTASPDLLPVSGFDPTAFTPGDTVLYSYDAGLGLQEIAMRVATIETTWNGRELMKLGFV